MTSDEIDARVRLAILDQRGRLLFSARVWRWQILIAVLEDDEQAEHEVVHIEQTADA